MIGTYTVLQSLHTISAKRYSEIFISSQFNPFPKMGRKKKLSLSKYISVYPKLFIKPKDSKNNFYDIFYDIVLRGRAKSNCLMYVDGKEFKGNAIEETYLCFYESELTSEGFKLYVGKDKNVCIDVKKSKHGSGYKVASIEVNNVKFDKYLAYLSFLVCLDSFCYDFFWKKCLEKLEELDINEVIKYIDNREDIGEISFNVSKIIQCDDFITMVLLYTGNKNYLSEFSFSIYKGKYAIISGTCCIIIYDIEDGKFWYMLTDYCNIKHRCFKTFDGVCIGSYKIKFNNGIEFEKKDDAYYYDVNGSYEALYEKTFYAPFGIPLNIAPVSIILLGDRILRVLPLLNNDIITNYYSERISSVNNETKVKVIYNYVPPLVTCVLKNE